MNSAPQSLRRHIAIFGRRNVGKSSLLNAITGQQVAIVSPEAGTTTDPVNRAMEILPLGPCLLIDTAGFDDVGIVGELRNERTHKVLDQADLAILVLDQAIDLSIEKQWLDKLQRLEIPTVVVLNKVDAIGNIESLFESCAKYLGITPIAVSAKKHEGIDELRKALAHAAGDDEETSLTADLAKPGDIVLLVMPQDPQAPKGRLILPQVQTIRDLLDKHCIIVSCGVDTLENSLNSLREPPTLIITDSQVFAQVYEKKPEGSLLTSFSVLMAGSKGNMDALIEGAKAIDRLTPQSRVLIAEACTHAPMSEDIGREKIPRMIRKKYGANIAFDIHAGKDYPADLEKYDLIVHCGACMFNRRLMLSRIVRAQEQGVPITNYGLAIAHLQGILDKVSLP
ncbi:MAG: [FeFe] hydrogenase H-cluster maturation GTPase HydF [Muribaculaceae bacterium]|nr:[FeFe] hydrogenase H-cluster maturation GTPase HydF [Muribaculaceae bacterium]